MLAKIIKYVILVLKILLLIYGTLYGVAYAHTQKACLSYKYEVTAVTWDFRPYCIGLYQGAEIVVPLKELQSSPLTPQIGPTF